jgi:phosphoribosylformimino-5-aminoimidazole carboxamide ribonucleotide (ProFAR) isomerase
VQREGRMTGADTERFSRLVTRSPHPLLASGGIAGAEDLRELERAGVAGAVLGMALYTGALDGHMVGREYAA